MHARHKSLRAARMKEDMTSLRPHCLSTVTIAAARTFDFECIAEPDAMAAAAPMASHLAIAHVQSARHGAHAEIGEAAARTGRRRALGRKFQNAGGLPHRIIFLCHLCLLPTLYGRLDAAVQ
ncbi:hypothetical protein MHY1_01743 [Methylovirgula sp. HY1]|nr:hypothetical protein MHY1_01743 [Methylovirgula sp. HY1]